MVGKSRSHVANALRLQTLPGPVKELINSGRLSAGHARALVGHHDAERLAEEIVARGLNVREVEAIVRKIAEQRGKQQTKSKNTQARATKNADTLALEKRLADALGLGVTIEHGERGGWRGSAEQTLNSVKPSTCVRAVALKGISDMAGIAQKRRS